MKLKELQAYYQNACLGRTLPNELKGKRVSVYRTLVRGSLDGVMEDLLPRTVARMGKLFWREAAAFYASTGPTSPYVRDVPSEFIRWAESRWPQKKDIAPYLLDLARHELVAMEVGAAPAADSPQPTGELALEHPAVFTEFTRVMRYQYAIHELPAEEEDRTVPPKRDVWLLATRTADHKLSYMDLTPAAAAILTRMIEAKQPVQQAIVEGAAEVGEPVSDALLQGTAALLAKLGERGVLLGGLLPSGADKG